MSTSSSNKSKGGFIRRNVDRVAEGGEHTSASSSTSVSTTAAIGMRQLLDEESSTYTYLLWDKETEDAILVDPVDSQSHRDLLVTTELNLVYCVNTHYNAHFISGTDKLKNKVKLLKSVISAASKAEADELIEHLDEIHFGNRYITAISTPSDTAGHLSFVLDDRTAILTGDAALLISGDGRTTDGSAVTLYDYVRDELLGGTEVPDACIVFPGRDYQGRTHSTIGEEKGQPSVLGCS